MSLEEEREQVPHEVASAAIITPRRGADQQDNDDNRDQQRDLELHARGTKVSKAGYTIPLHGSSSLPHRRRWSPQRLAHQNFCCQCMRPPVTNLRHRCGPRA